MKETFISDLYSYKAASIIYCIIIAVFASWKITIIIFDFLNYNNASSKTIYHGNDRFRSFSQKGDRLISGYFSTGETLNVKFNITLCIKCGNRRQKFVKMGVFLQKFNLKIANSVCGGVAFVMRFLFFFLDTLKTELTVMAGGMDFLADLH